MDKKLKPWQLAMYAFAVVAAMNILGLKGLVVDMISIACDAAIIGAVAWKLTLLFRKNV